MYDPRVGEEGLGINAGTPFDKLPLDWVSPDCGATKDYFEVEEE